MYDVTLMNRSFDQYLGTFVLENLNYWPTETNWECQVSKCQPRICNWNWINELKKDVSVCIKKKTKTTATLVLIWFVHKKLHIETVNMNGIHSKERKNPGGCFNMAGTPLRNTSSTQISRNLVRQLHGQPRHKLWANEISRDLNLKWVSEGCPIR